MGREVYRNDRDESGNLRVGVNYVTGLQEVAEDEVLSVSVTCDASGFTIQQGDDVVRQNGKIYLAAYYPGG